MFPKINYKIKVFLLKFTVRDFDEKTRQDKQKKPILKRWSVSLVLENIFISFIRV